MTGGTARNNRRCARLAGATFLIYIGAGMAETALFRSATGSGPAPAMLTNLVAHAPLVHLSAALALVTIFSALVLGVSLFAITRHYDLDLAVLALAARVAEAVIGAAYILPSLGMLALTQAGEPMTDHAFAFTMLNNLRDGAMVISAACFALGSTVFAYLFLRARSLPSWLARLGLFASLLLLGALPLQLAIGARSSAIWWVWLPMLVFEIVFAFYLLFRPVGSRSLSTSV